MNILAIETSCDDTCAAVLEIKNSEFKTRSNIISSQAEIHKKWGGVYPTLAKREHQKNLPIVLKKALKKAKNPKIDSLAVTVGPGLEPCLWTGVNFVKELARKMNLRIVPVNHIEAHLLVNLLPKISEISNSKSLISKQIDFPAICLIVSGGHTQLVLMEKISKYKVIGETRDDAAGECFDKTARILGLDYPGGPAISAEATKCDATNAKYNIQLPRPMIYQKNYDFSFSGLKTAVLYDFKKRPPKTKRSRQYIREMCAEIQQAVIDVLIRKTITAANNHKAKSIILSGGVAANNELRKQLESKVKKLKINFLVPPRDLCTDNAVMAAIAGYFNRKGKGNWKKIKANANLKIGEKL